jgi:predicted RNase H-like HicB family nuclease
MQKRILNYLILIEKEELEDGSVSYLTNVPKLGISDFGSTIEEAIAHTEQVIKIDLETLEQLGEPIPESDKENTIITSSKINYTPHTAVVA